MESAMVSWRSNHIVSRRKSLLSSNDILWIALCDIKLRKAAINENVSFVTNELQLIKRSVATIWTIEDSRQEVDKVVWVDALRQRDLVRPLEALRCAGALSLTVQIGHVILDRFCSAVVFLRHVAQWSNPCFGRQTHTYRVAQKISHTTKWSKNRIKSY